MVLISVIMPAFNASKYIREAINSILNQTESNFELLICDDGSTDDTFKIINSFSDKRIIVFQNKINLGNLQTTNFLLAQCKGKYITIQDADDYSSSNRFSNLINEFLEDKTLGMVGSNYEVINEKNESLLCGNLPLDDREIKEEMKKKVIPMLYAGVMIKKEILKEVGFFRVFFNRKGFADLDWLARCAELTKTKNSRDCLYFYRKHENSFTEIHAKKSSLIFDNIHLLIVTAHLERMQGKIDFFEKKDTHEMKKIICQYYIKRAENLFWEHKIHGSFSNLFKALQANFLEAKVYKTFFFIFRKNLYRLLKNQSKLKLNIFINVINTII